MAIATDSTPTERLARGMLWIYSVAVLIFLIAPVLVIVPLSFNSAPFFTFPPSGVSLRWYGDVLGNPSWLQAIWNSVLVALSTTVLATALGTMAASGLSRQEMPYRSFIVGLLISPMIVPAVIVAVGTYQLFSTVGLLNSLPGLVAADTVLAVPFVVMTVSATFANYDTKLTKAALSLGATPLRAFRTVTMPLIMPGVTSGALFAFVTSFDETVLVQFLAGPNQRTLPKQMFEGISEEVSPTITAVATALILMAVALLTAIELLRRRSDRLRGRD
jgi:putative spermidine/putrescine transport system permease protein